MARRDFYDTVSLILWLSLMLGIFPTFVGKIGEKTAVKTNKLCTAVTIFYFTMFLVVLYLGTHDFNPLTGEDIYSFNTLAKLCILLVMFVGYSLSFLLLIQSCFHKDRFKDFLNAAAAIDGTLTKLGHTFDRRRDLFINVTVILAGPALMISNLVMQLWNLQRGVEGLPRMPPLLLVAQLYTFALIHQGESLFVMSNVILQRRFEAINTALQKMSCRWKRRQRSGGALRECESDGAILDACMRCHDELCDLRDSVATLFGFLVIAGSVSQFNTVIFAFCYCYYSASLRPISSIGWFVWAVQRIYELARKAISAHISTNEVQATLNWIRKLLIHGDINQEDKLNMFAFQIRHRGLPLTALGVFPIDATFAFTIIGACTTYITIIYQFQANNVEC